MLRFENAWIADGSGKEPYRGTLIVDGNTIAAVLREKVTGISNADTIDCGGNILAPGFIDAHGHSDISILAAPQAESKITQGITTEIAGNCGLSPFPLTDENREHLADLYANYSVEMAWNDYLSYRRTLDAAAPHMHLESLCGHNTLRAAVAGYEQSNLNGTQLSAMKKLLEEALKSGARGMSSGLLYVPGKFSNQEELEMLLQTVANHNSIYTTHLRSEGEYLIESIAETLETAERAGLKKLHISHFKTAGRKNWNKLDDAINLIDDARARGMQITVDRYPYVESMTQLSVVLPPPWDDLSDIEIQKRLQNPENAHHLADELKKSRPDDYWNTVRLAATGAAEFRNQCGKHFSNLNIDAVSAVIQILSADAAGSCAAFCGMSDNNLTRIIDLDYCMPGSDGNALPADGSLGRSHPRAFGAIAKFIRRRLDSTGKIGETIRRATSLPAEVFSLQDRGTIAPGKNADLVLFNPDEIDSGADFDNPHKTASGIIITACSGNVFFRR